MSTVDFRKYTLPTPAYTDVVAHYDQLTRAFDVATSGDAAIAAVEAWDALRRKLYTWSALVNIRFNQDTRNEHFQKVREYCDELEPKLTNLAVAMKRRVMDSPHRDAVAKRFGTHAFELWKCDVASFDPAIEDELVRQAKLAAEYTALLASAKIDFQGESLTISQIRKYREHPDRAVRHEASRLHWDWFAVNQTELDVLFDNLVRLRQQMAEKRGYQNFISLGYQRMQRIGYGEAEVDQFRAEVLKHVVPLAAQIRRQQAEKLGVDPLMAWDEELHDPAGNPKPRGDHDWTIHRAREMFARLGGGMGEFFDKMCAGNLMDLKSREGKAGGGFCDVLPDCGMPFIYGNFNGTSKDVEVLVHEMGHAYQVFCSLNQPLVDYLFPTSESCEIHSIGLEFLTWPEMEFFFGEDAERFRRQHLIRQILFLPYGAAVDHFQHLVYANPHASADDRAAMWQEMERTYLPGLEWGDLNHPARGRRWQSQLHIYKLPFYYIDYTLALTCALQLWARAAKDREAALETFVQLCRCGGEAPFGELVNRAGLTFPFERGCLKGVIDRAQRYLNAPM